jgi:hypothetical protein
MTYYKVKNIICSLLNFTFVKNTYNIKILKIKNIESTMTINNNNFSSSNSGYSNSRQTERNHDAQNHVRINNRNRDIPQRNQISENILRLLDNSDSDNDVVMAESHPSPRRNSTDSSSTQNQIIQNIPQIPARNMADNHDDSSLTDISSMHTENHISIGSSHTPMDIDYLSDGIESIISQASIRRQRISNHYGMDEHSINTNIFSQNS